MKERDIVSAIKAELDRRGVLAMKYHGTVYGVKGHSDLYGVLPEPRWGRSWFVEVKKPGKSLTEPQKAFLARMASHGAVVGVAHSKEEAVDILGLDK